MKDEVSMGEGAAAGGGGLPAESTAQAETWRELCACFTEDPGLWAAVRAVEIEPGSSPKDEASARWLVLVEWLEGNRGLFVLDWKDFSDEFEWGLRQLSMIEGSGIDVSPVNWEHVHLGFAAIRADQILAQHGLATLYLDVDSDSYQIAVVRTAVMPRIIELSRLLGQKARSITAADALDGQDDYYEPM